MNKINKMKNRNMHEVGETSTMTIDSQIFSIQSTSTSHCNLENKAQWLQQ